MENSPSSIQTAAPSGSLPRVDLQLLLKIRLLALALGQKEAANWWSCSFLTSSGGRFLATPFPRSAFWAACHASSLAAARHHDERIGAGGTVHLFRLGQEVEIQIRDKVLRDGWRPDFEPSSTRGILLGHLKELANAPEKAPAGGPMRVSDRNRFTGSKMLSQVAGLYADAFEKGIQILPYGADK
jgi:hypothetical protein